MRQINFIVIIQNCASMIFKNQATNRNFSLFLYISDDQIKLVNF